MSPLLWRHGLNSAQCFHPGCHPHVVAGGEEFDQPGATGHAQICHLLQQSTPGRLCPPPARFPDPEGQLPVKANLGPLRSQDLRSKVDPSPPSPAPYQPLLVSKGWTAKTREEQPADFCPHFSSLSLNESMFPAHISLTLLFPTQGQTYLLLRKKLKI